MKLTNYIRDAFVSSVMNDVPTIDYAEQAFKVFMPAYLATLPKSVQDNWNDPAAREYIRTSYTYLCNQSFIVPSMGHNNVLKPVSVADKLGAINALHKAQSDSMSSLRAKIKGAAYACNTTKQLRELLPEFERYLPAEEEKTLRSLPAVQNIVADFVKAGWPDKKKGVKA